MRKSLKDISWQVDEEIYRADEAHSYSTIAKFHREGFEKLSSLYDKVDSPSLRWGSALDTLLTDGEIAFNERFIVACFPDIPDSQINVIKTIFKNTEGKPWKELKTDDFSSAIDECKFQPNWRPETRVKVLKENGEQYYNLMVLASGKTILTSEEYNDVITCVDLLKTSDATKWYFQEDDPFDDSIERLYQLKFKGEYEGIPLRIMADLIVVNHDTKEIIPCDLKSTKSIITFNNSFYKCSYYIQAQLYTYILQQVIKQDSYFKDFKIKSYKFIAIDRHLKQPVVFDYSDNFREVSLVDDCGITHENWRTIVKDLDWYIKNPNCFLPKNMWEEFNQNFEVKIKKYE